MPTQQLCFPIGPIEWTVPAIKPYPINQPRHTDRFEFLFHTVRVVRFEKCPLWWQMSDLRAKESLFPGNRSRER